jgi:hypothetical protein
LIAKENQMAKKKKMKPDFSKPKPVKKADEMQDENLEQEEQEKIEEKEEKESPEKFL